MKRMIFENFPKVRPELPEEYKKIYDEHYRNNREGNSASTSLSQRLESWMHYKVASDVKNNTTQNLSTLEIGAGNLNHLKYEPEILNYDVVEPFANLLNTSSVKSRVRNIFNDISDIDGTHKYDRIISIACFEHVTNLPEMIEKAVTLLKPGGRMRVAIPNEGTLMWRLGTMVTGYEFKKRYGLDYQILMKHEHVNTANEIEEILKFYFKNVRCSVFGLNKKFAFYRFYNCMMV